MLVSLAVDKSNYVLFSFTARPILRASSTSLEKAGKGITLSEAPLGGCQPLRHIGSFRVSFHKASLVSQECKTQTWWRIGDPYVECRKRI